MAQQPSIYKYLKKITKERSESSSLCDRSSQGFAPPPPKVSKKAASVGSSHDVDYVDIAQEDSTEEQGFQFRPGESHQEWMSTPILPSAIPTTSTTAASSAPTDLSAASEPATQPKLKQYPVTVFGHKTRSFSSHWYERYAFLEYSISKDAVFCKMCRLFGEKGGEDKFRRHGYRDWKHINTACYKHENSRAHLMAVEKYNNYRECHKSDRGTVLHQLFNADGRQDEIIERNRDHIKVILDIVLTCAKQEIPLRGYRENDERKNAGNFLELFKLICKHNPDIQKRLDDIPSNAKMLSHDIQNELLNAASTLLLRRIKKELHESEGTFYAILADECKDTSKKELVAVCLRYVYKGVVKERAIGLLDTDDMTAEGIAKMILEVVTPLELDPNLCVGFGFDGASVMAGQKGGVQAILKSTFQKAIYVHCHSHRLNLVLASVARTSADASTFFDTVNSLHTFMCGSQRHARFLDAQKTMYPDRRALELERGCDTRWSSRSSAVSKVLILYDVIIEVLSEYAEGGGQCQIDAQSLLQQMRTKKFIFFLVLFKELFNKSDFATKGLQSTSVSVTDAVDLIENLKQSLTDMRSSNDEFLKMLAMTNQIMADNSVDSFDISLPYRSRKLPSRFEQSTVTTSLGKSTRVRSDEDLQALLNILIDCQLNELGARFHTDSYGLMNSAATLLSPACDRSLTEMTNSLNVAGKLFHINVTESELSVFLQHTKRKKERGETFKTLIDVLDVCSEEVFPHIHCFLKALITLPMTSCTVERVFSSVNLTPKLALSANIREGSYINS
ncbi:zinc finger MYM-type 1-like protein [Labeo rohita]|uniref:Zinc finger MYM-type 1-like protein n=2 Tax=Labeonini TaxID=2743697 RepID=A0A498N342_LABRO|nr:zinc finger MYM-type 1-like protein [Labeo rohita]